MALVIRKTGAGQSVRSLAEIESVVQVGFCHRLRRSGTSPVFGGRDGRRTESPEHGTSAASCSACHPELNQGISVNRLLETIKSALLTAYQHTQSHQTDASRSTGKAGVVPGDHRETTMGLAISSASGTTHSRGASAGSPPRRHARVMLQRFRDAENETHLRRVLHPRGEILFG